MPSIRKCSFSIISTKCLMQQHTRWHSDIGSSKIHGQWQVRRGKNALFYNNRSLVSYSLKPHVIVGRREERNTRDRVAYRRSRRFQRICLSLLLSLCLPLSRCLSLCSQQKHRSDPNNAPTTKIPKNGHKKDSQYSSAYEFLSTWKFHPVTNATPHLNLFMNSEVQYLTKKIPIWHKRPRFIILYTEIGYFQWPTSNSM